MSIGTFPQQNQDWFPLHGHWIADLVVLKFPDSEKLSLWSSPSQENNDYGQYWFELKIKHMSLSP